MALIRMVSKCPGELQEIFEIVLAGIIGDEAVEVRSAEVGRKLKKSPITILRVLKRVIRRQYLLQVSDDTFGVQVDEGRGKFILLWHRI